VQIVDDTAVAQLFCEVLRRTHLSKPSEAAAILAEQAADIGARDVAIYVVDYELEVLVRLYGRAAEGEGPLPITGTVAGRAFSATTLVDTPDPEGGGRRLRLPLLDGTERIGAMAMTFPDGIPITDELRAVCERYAHLAALILVAKGAHGDTLELARRRQPMTVASELVWALAPPLVFVTDGLALAGLLEPCYDNGGDAFDYAVDDETLHVALFDAMGHGLAAAGVAAFALSAYRRSRRTGADLRATHAAMDAAVAEQFPEDRFVTALIAQLDLSTGRLCWISAGHPPPLILRRGRHAARLRARPCSPLGLGLAGAPPVSLAEQALEPGDSLLLYSDGLTEARGEDGRPFTVDRLGDFIAREAAGGQAAPEVLRRLRHAILGREGVRLTDDATAVLLQWRSGAEAASTPPTVLE
jgi:hypothetical protein